MLQSAVMDMQTKPVAFVVIGVKVLGGKKGKADQNDDELYGEGEEEEDEPEPLDNLDEEEE